MSPPSYADNNPAAAVSADESPSCWRYSWETQSHASTLRLLLFNPNIKPSIQCRDFKVNLLSQSQQSLLTVSYLETEAQLETYVRVPIPRVIIDPDSPLHCRAFHDHIEVKLVLLLPVDHPLVSEFDSILSVEENRDELRPLSLDPDVKKLSCMKEVHFYCRNCSSKLTKGLSCFEEMPSVNWRDSADNWFGNCCCSFGGVSEKLVAEYVKSYVCAPGVCLLNKAAVLISKNDLLGCEFPEVEANQNSRGDNCLSEVSLDEAHRQVQTGCCENHSERILDVDRTINVPLCKDDSTRNAEYRNSKHLLNEDGLAETLSALQIEANKRNQICDSGVCIPAVRTNGGNVQLLENQKVFQDGYLGNGFMVRSSGLSKDIQWVEFLCPQCSCLVGAYPCFDDNVPLDGGVRLFKCYTSTCLPSSGSNDVFVNYTLEKMFVSQLLESAEDELSFRTIVRDMQTKSPELQIVLLNPNSWSSAGSLHPEEPSAKLVMHPTIKMLFSTSSHGMEFDSRTQDEWVRKNQADEIYMFSSQIHELIQILELANSLSPPSCASLQGLLLSSMRR